MEYKIFKKIQKIPYFVRIILGVFFMIFGIIAALIPIIPGAVFGLVIGLLFFISARKIKKVIKIRKGLLHLFQNFSKQKLKQKFNDIKLHLKHIFFD